MHKEEQKEAEMGKKKPNKSQEWEQRNKKKSETKSEIK